MKLGRNIGSVTIPKRPLSVGGLLAWARAANKTLQELRDRKVSFSNPGRPASSGHPWKVTANGDATVNIGYGSLLAFHNNWLTLREFKHFAGTVEEEISAVTVTGTGSIYGKIAAEAALDLFINSTLEVIPSDPTATVDVDYLRTFPSESEFEPITFLFSATVPGNIATDWYFELAKVELTDGIASVTRQILTHNPTLAGFVDPPS